MINAFVLSSLAVPSRDKVIAVMGPTGAGKSAFIRNSVPPGLAKDIKVGHGLKSETDQVQPVSWVAEDGTSIKLVDTPGFDDSREGVTDAQVLKMIATFLTNEYGKKSQLTGLVYVHRISDTRVGGTSQRNLRMFRKLCGIDSLKNVVIVTTMWDKVTPEEGSRREQELMSSNNLFKPLLDGGATMMRYERTAESATKVINHLLGKKATTTQIVREMMHETKTLEETAAGGELRSEIEALLKRHKEDMELLKAELREMAQRELAEERQKMDQKLDMLLKELDELKRGITVPITNDPPPSYEFASDFPAPQTTCVVNYSRLLQLFNIHQSALAPAHSELLSSVVSGATQFANAVERSVSAVQHGLPMLRLVLTSQSVHSLQQFMKADPHPRAFTYGIWTKARDDMEILTNETKAILSKYTKSRIPNVLRNAKIKRFDALNTILASMEGVVTHMETMVTWWTPIIDALGKIEDATHRMRAGTGFDDNAVKVTLSRIIRALGSYCDAYTRCSEDIRKAAVGLPSN